MNHARFRFYEELNDFLPQEKKKKQFEYSFNGTPSVKDAIESMGIPHIEVDLILINGIPVDFSRKLRHDDTVSVYPAFETLDISSLVHLREKPLRITKFIPDVHLGKLAKLLRLCGFDTLYERNLNDNEIIDISVSEKRIILTRDIGLLKNRKVTHGYWIRSQQPDVQLKEVLLKFDLKDQLMPFTRCIECNGILTSVSKAEIIDRLQPGTSEYFTNFMMCRDCQRIYWKGSHFDKMNTYLDQLINGLNKIQH